MKCVLYFIEINLKKLQFKKQINNAFCKKVKTKMKKLFIKKNIIENKSYLKKYFFMI